MRSNPITLVGIALIILGIVAFAYQGITYTSREKIIDIGPIQATADTQKSIPLSPLLGGLVFVGGSLWLWLEPRHRLSASEGCLPRAMSRPNDRGSISKKLDRGKLTWRAWF